MGAGREWKGSMLKELLHLQLGTWRAELKLADPEESQTQEGGSGRKRGAVGTELQEVLRVPQSQSQGRGMWGRGCSLMLQGITENPSARLTIC